MALFRGIEYATLKEWKEACILAHTTCKGVKGYTSKSYAENPIISNNGFILAELKGFETELKTVLNFVDLDMKIIKQPVI